MRLVRNAMITFGLTSTVFDLLTFVVLWRVANGDETLFRTGWFLESLLTELLVLFMLRTSLPFYRSRPGRFLSWSSAVIFLVALWLPFSPLAGAMGFEALPAEVLLAILGITVAYALATERIKAVFFRHHARALT
jgi:Mg2+-importing ATPase